MLVLSFLVANCASTSASGESEPGVSGDQSPVGSAAETRSGDDRELIFRDQAPEDDEVRKWEREFEQYLREAVLPSDILQEGGFEVYEKRRDAKNDRFNQIQYLYAGKHIEVRESDQPERPIGTFTIFRVAQLYFDFGCQIQALEPPSDTSGRDWDDIEKLRENVRVIFRKAKGSFGTTEKVPVDPWTKKARAILADMPDDMSELDSEMAESLCTEHRRMWASPKTLQAAREE
jgi:hypothetical protein